MHWQIDCIAPEAIKSLSFYFLLHKICAILSLESIIQGLIVFASTKGGRMSISLYKFMVNILSTLQGVMPMPLPEGKRGLKNTEIHSVLSKTKERICTAELVVGIIVNTLQAFYFLNPLHNF